MPYKWFFFGCLFLLNLKRVLCPVFRLQTFRKPLPQPVEDVYNEKEFEIAKDRVFTLARYDLSFALVEFAIHVSLLLSDGLAWFVRLFSGDLYGQSVALCIAATLTELLLSFLHEFVYGRLYSRLDGKKTDIPNIFSDLSSVLLYGSVMFLANMVAYDENLANGGPSFSVGYLLVVVLAVALCALYLWLVRKSRKLSPLEDSPLREHLLAIIKDEGVSIGRIMVSDAKSCGMYHNACFHGLGRWSTIEIGRGCLEDFPDDAVLAILTHEIGHRKYHDVPKAMLINLLWFILSFTIFVLLAMDTSFYTSFGFDGPCLSFAMWPTLWILISLWRDALFVIPIKHFQRRCEYRADAVATSHGFGDYSIHYEKIAMREQKLIPDPGKWLIRLDYSHPAPADRIAAIQTHMKRSV